MNLSFSTAVADDALAIAVLRNAASESLTRRYGEGSWSSHTTEKSVLRDLDRPRFFQNIIARKNSTIVASLCLQTKKPWAIDATYFTNVNKPLYLINMAVHPDWQGKGVGRLLMKEAARVAQGWPCDGIRLDAWDASAGAGPFYAKCGYRQVGRKIYRHAPLIYYELVF